MKLTRHRLRLALGLLTCSVGLVFFFAPGLLFHRIMDGAAWLLIGGLLCFVPEFHLKFTRDSFTLVLGLVIGAAGLFLTLAAAGEFVGPRAHGWLRFYKFVGIGPLLLTTGVLIGFSKMHANKAHALDSGIPHLFHTWHHWPAASGAN